MKSKYSSKFKKAAFGLTCVATSLLIGMTAACAQNNTTDDEEDNKVTTKEDLQDIKNGNFEFYNDNEGLYPISTPDSWSFSYSGTSSTAMSGIIKTSKEGWDYLTDPTLPETLDENDKLDSESEIDSLVKKDYNGALSDDMLYKNSHNALDDDKADSEVEEEDKKAYIANPNTHNLRWDEAAEKYVYVDENGDEVPVYTDEDGKVYTDEEHKNEIGTSVLMIHNYRKDSFRGNEGYYESSTTISLEANTTCKISLWVKTAELYSDNSSGNRAEATFNKGAYIKVDSTVGGNSLDSFTIKNINTEVLNTTDENNGWVQYTVYVQASSFATTTVSLSLGLGENGSNGINTVEGYAFFDDITFEKYRNIELLKADNADFNSAIRFTDGGNEIANTCYPLTADADMDFRVDKPAYKTENPSTGEVVDKTLPNNFEDRSFYINFASTQADVVALSSANVKSGLTVDSNKYISSKNTNYKTSGVGALDNGASTAKLPTNIKNDGLTVSSDLLALKDIGSNWTLNESGFEYNNLLTDALKSAYNLPDVNGSAKTLIMLSANGAAYETKISDTSDTFTIDDGEYKLISFWLKTSAFDGKTAATITVYDPDDDVNTSSYSLDSTSLGTVSFGDEKDIYDGWVRCFIKVANNSGENGKNFGIKINLGNTSIKGTTSTDYKYGWLAVANFTVLNLDEDVYDYTSGLSNSTELSFAETTDTFTNAFDSEQGGSNNQIKTDLATPAKYTGANGNSVSVKPTGSAATDYDTTNNNDFAGLLNKENLNNYKDKDWYSSISTHLPGSAIDNEQIWEALAGKYSYQPLLIVNAVRQVSAGMSGLYNYGYIGSKSTFSSNSYAKVSVRVKVSSGAIAYVYLIDTDSENNDVLTYKTPDVNFYYDDDGNILKEAADSDDTKAEAEAKIAYKLREDGLYENGDGKLYANYYNLTKYYDYKYEHESFFDAEGNAVTFENLVTGVTYYADANKTKLAPHYLIAGGKENNKVYEYAGEVDGKSTYYYMEKGVANKDKVVYGVDKSIASYTYDPSTATPYSFVINGNDATYTNKWVTVTFNVHTGNQAKNYRLELWAGERDKQTTDGVAPDSYVLFDYSPESANSLDQSSYESKLSYYTDAIRADLIENISGELPDNDQSIAQLEKLVGSGYTNIYNYSATYYTFSLYDSPSFIPFNAETAADGQEGYSYIYSDYEEALGLLKVVDTDDVDNLSMTAFVDYSLTDKEFEIIGEPTIDTDTDEDTEETQASSTNVWLLAASIAIVAAILVAIVAILVKQFIKNHGKTRKYVGKNTYNFNKNKRYVKKYVKANGEAPEVTEGADEFLTLENDGEDKKPE